MRLSVIIPTYNGEGKIKETIFSTRNYLARQSYDWEIIVVNDGSTDRTAEVVRECEAQIPELKFINNEANHGKGFAVRRGMLAASGESRLFMDDDNSTRIEEIEKFWPHTREAKVIIGSINIEGALVQEGAQWYRRFLGNLAKYIIRAVSGLWEIKDTQRGFKLFSASAAEAIFSKLTIERFGFDIETLVLAKKLGLKIQEVPIRWNNPAASSVKLASYFATLKELFQIRWNLWRGWYNK